MKKLRLIRLFTLILVLQITAVTSVQASWLSDLIDSINNPTDDTENPNQPRQPENDRILSIIPKIGVVGDSLSDEYATYPYGIGAINWVMFLEKTNKGELGDFKSLRMYPRLYGYEYNWARVGATTADLLAENQHTGLENQIRTGKIEVAVVFIGANDFREAYDAIYNNEWTQAQKDQFVDGFKDRISVAIDTLYNAGPKMLVIATVPDLGDSANYRFNNYPEADNRQNVTDLLIRTNDWIKEKAEENGSIVLDLFSYFKEMVDEPIYRYHGFRIDTTSGGSDPQKFFAIDAFHPGSMPQSRIANRLLIMIEDERVKRINDKNLAERADNETTPFVLLEPAYNLLTPAEIFENANVPPSAEIFFPESEFTDPSENVVRSPWFGILAIDQYPWINHAEHGWMYCEGYGGKHVQLWDSNLGWLLTSPEDYPKFLRISDQHLLRYESGSTQPRRFFDETTNAWIEIPYGAQTKE